MATYYAAFLDLRGRRALVVGGGAVAERKVSGLLDAGARVRVVSPRLTEALAALSSAGIVEHRARAFKRSDVRGCVIVVAATGVPDVDDEVAEAARCARALVNVVDRAEACDFILPSVLRRGDLQIAVSTGGQSPALAREIRRRLEDHFDEDCGAVIAWAGRTRARVMESGRTDAGRRRAAERIAAAALRRLAPAVTLRRLAPADARGRRASPTAPVDTTG